jgi:DinB family protein
MTTSNQKRPLPSEYASYYDTYVRRVTDGDICQILEGQLARTQALLTKVGEARAGHRYSPEKWSIREVVGHIIDAERIFAYRALCFARSEKKHLPGFDQDSFVQAANFERRTLSDLTTEFELVRKSNVILFRSFPDEVWERRGVANNVEFTVRSIPYIIAGHELHHCSLLKERYLI